MKKKYYIFFILLLLIIICQNVLAEQGGDHCFKAVIPFIANELKGKEENINQFIGVDVWTNKGEISKNAGLYVMIEDYGYPQSALVGAIENTDDSNIKNIICVWKSQYDYDTYSSKYGTKVYAHYYISVMDEKYGINQSIENAVVSANHDDYNQFPNRKAILPLDDAYYEEISQEEYNRYITKDGSAVAVKKSNNSSNDSSLSTYKSKSSNNKSSKKKTKSSNNNYNENKDMNVSASVNKQNSLNQYKITGWHQESDG